MSRDHREVLFGRRLQDLADVQQPRLAEDRDDRRGGVEEQPDLLVVRRRATSLRRVDPNAASRARRNVRCFACSKNSMSLRVRAGPAALDVVDAEGVEPLGDPQLVGDREGDAFALRAVAQGRVVDFDVMAESCCMVARAQIVWWQSDVQAPSGGT